MKGIKKYLKDNLGIILALVAMILFLYVYPKTHNTFLTTNNIFNVLRQSATNLMLACGMTMVIILGGIDLSVGSIIAMSGVLGAAAVVWHGLPEIINMADRVYVMYDGRITGCIDYENVSQEAIMKLATLETAGGADA